MVQAKPAGQREWRLGAGAKIDITYLAAILTKKMAVIPHVRAEPGRAAIQDHLPDEAALDEHT